MKSNSQHQNLANLLATAYEKYKVASITERRFKHRLVKELVNSLPSIFEVQEIGRSVENREIYLVKIGSGSKKLLFWSQMHGDESTATAALFDIFAFLGNNSNEKANENANENATLEALRIALLESCTFYFVPMLNPDGAEVWQRRNALQIDLNRDALALQAPESRYLKQLQQSIQPDFGFNLHDQNIYYTTGNSRNNVVIAFLAPPVDEAKTINPVRHRAMQVIGLLAAALQEFIPKQVAKFSDDFEPRAFGDNIQKWGTSTILVESGAYIGDAEKQYIRKLNFVLLLLASQIIANDEYQTLDLQGYNNIPQNEKRLRDLVLRNVNHPQKTGVKIDIAFFRNEITVFEQTSTTIAYKSLIDDIGDLCILFGYEEQDCAAWQTEVIGRLEIGENPTLIFKNAVNQQVALVENGFLKIIP
jgi:hypothetical protein